MKLKTTLSLLALASCAALSTSALAQSSGTINIKGNILPVSCSPTVNGNTGGNYTVTLPDVNINQFTSAGSTAGATEIKFEWTGCSTGSVNNVWVHFGDGGTNVDSDGLIVPVVAAGAPPSKMRFELLDGMTGPRVRAGGTAPGTGPGTNQGSAAAFVGVDPNRTATKTYAVRYYATQGLVASDAAPLSSSVTYNAYYY